MAAVARLPWWVGVALAAGSFAGLHYYAGQPVAAPAVPGSPKDSALSAVAHGAAQAFQFILPVLGLAGAGVSVWQRRRRHVPLAEITRVGGPHAVDGLSWREFQMLVGEAFRLRGYRIEETGADGGVDLVLSMGSERFLVQCGKWKSPLVGVEVVRELHGAMEARGATGGFVVTSGRFSRDATAFALGLNLKLIDGPKLHELLKSARAATAHGSTTVAKRVDTSAPTSSPVDGSPPCPVCAGRMTRRIAARGANAGKAFWGCARFPDCRGIRPLQT